MFNKRGSVDIIDLPDLYRRKLISIPESPLDQETQITKDGFFDLSISSQNTSNSQPIAKDSKEETSFLNDFASIGSSNQNSQIEVKKENNSEEVSNLKWRIENLEYKLEQLIEKVNSSNQQSNT